MHCIDEQTYSSDKNFALQLKFNAWPINELKVFCKKNIWQKKVWLMDRFWP